jgi:DNA-binding MarR family transcriptional regulator
MSRDKLSDMNDGVRDASKDQAGRAGQAAGQAALTTGQAAQVTGRAARTAGQAAQTAGHGGPATDEVDQIVEEWHAQRPDLDVAPLQVLSRIWRLARHLDRARAAAFAGHGLEPWEFDVLSCLRRQGPPYRLSPGNLLRATMVTSGTMTNRIDRLEESGLVRREPDPLDKRGVLVSLTGQGLVRVDLALSALLGSEQALLAGLTAVQRADLAALLRTLLAPFDADPP